MPVLSELLSSDTLNWQPVPGLSLFFILLFYAPLVAVAFAFLVYSVFARGSVIRAARVLSLIWLVACVPATLLMLMGHAFNSSGNNIFVRIPAWIGIGLLLLWLPVLLRKVCRVHPV
ncbi:MAG TPA: hypothetical protein VHH11_09730 [Gammaproteobacteria bacterium]|jgi:hypothetical protein|nr:hypothetical protein [Gammaproteobacteria bacterium]